MKTPQLENGYLKISNELMEAFCRFRIPGSVRQIVDCIILKTYGFNKKEDWISGSQLMKMTGKSKQNVWTELSKAIKHKIVTQNNDRLRLNKHHNEWVPFRKNTKLGTKVTQNVYSTKSNTKRLPKVTQNKGHKRQTTKDKEIYKEKKEILDFFNSCMKSKYKALDETNFSYWMETYTIDEIKLAIQKIPLDDFWKDKITPTILFRKRNPRGENVDWIGHFMNVKNTNGEIIDGRVIHWQ